MSAANRTLLVDGNNLRSYGNVTKLDIYAPGTRRVENDTIRKRRGVFRATAPVLDAFGFTVSMEILGTDDADLYSKQAALGLAVAGDSGNVALTRRVPKATSPFYLEHTANGQFVGFAGWEHINDCSVKVDLQFLNTSGGWLSGSTWLVP